MVIDLCARRCQGKEEIGVGQASAGFRKVCTSHRVVCKRRPGILALAGTGAWARTEVRPSVSWESWGPGDVVPGTKTPLMRRTRSWRKRWRCRAL